MELLSMIVRTTSLLRSFRCVQATTRALVGIQIYILHIPIPKIRTHQTFPGLSAHKALFQVQMPFKQCVVPNGWGTLCIVMAPALFGSSSVRKEAHKNIVEGT
jgi:hypothetical protein